MKWNEIIIFKEWYGLFANNTDNEFSLNLVRFLHRDFPKFRWKSHWVVVILLECITFWWSRSCQATFQGHLQFFLLRERVMEYILAYSSALWSTELQWSANWAWISNAAIKKETDPLWLREEEWRSRKIGRRRKSPSAPCLAHMLAGRFAQCHLGLSKHKQTINNHWDVKGTQLSAISLLWIL